MFFRILLGFKRMIMSWMRHSNPWLLGMFQRWIYWRTSLQQMRIRTWVIIINHALERSKILYLKDCSLWRFFNRKTTKRTWLWRRWGWKSMVCLLRMLSRLLLGWQWKNLQNMWYWQLSYLYLNLRMQRMCWWFLPSIWWRDMWKN